MRIQCFPGVNLRFRAKTQFEAAFPASSPASPGPANPIFPLRRINTSNADASGRTRSRFANRQKRVQGVIDIRTTRDYFIRDGAIEPADRRVLHRRLRGATSFSY